MNYPAASSGASKALKSVIPHVIEPAPYLIRGNPASKTKRPRAFLLALMLTLWTPAKIQVTDKRYLRKIKPHTLYEIKIKQALPRKSREKWE